MIPNRAPIPVDKLALAVVHAPDRAIPAPAGAREESLRFLLQTAADSGVTRVATKPDGDGDCDPRSEFHDPSSLAFDIGTSSRDFMFRFPTLMVRASPFETPASRAPQGEG